MKTSQIKSKHNVKIVTKYQRTKKGLMSKMFNHQKCSSKTRGHDTPSYTRQELSNWLLNDWLFNLLYDNWKNCGYPRPIKPSIDRIDDSKGYSLDNIQIMTWKENNTKSHKDHKSGKITYDQKAVK